MAQGVLRDFLEIKKDKFNDEKLSTCTTREQIKTELSIEKCFDRFHQLQSLNASVTLCRDEHIKYLKSSLRGLSSNYQCLDSSRPWLIYWILNSAHILNFRFPDELLDNTIDFLVKCRNEHGGFGGGPGQMSHLAPTYAAVNSLCIIGSEKAYNAIDRNNLKKFIAAVRQPDGSFCLHEGGEIDVRGAYCALSCAKLANFSQKDEQELFKGTADWIKSCQTYEGGFGGTPDLEAHGGYTFCGLAALVLLGDTNNLDLELLMKWAVARQMRFEGGFQGRTNKLVDGCYSFWVGATVVIIQTLLGRKSDTETAKLLAKPVFDRGALQEYILLCCQRQNGGLLDKPGKPPDLYHTCYTLSGLAISQHCEFSMEPLVLGRPDNEVLPVHPLHNLPPRSVLGAYLFFEMLNNDFNTEEEMSDSANTSNTERETSINSNYSGKNSSEEDADMSNEI